MARPNDKAPENSGAPVPAKAVPPVYRFKHKDGREFDVDAKHLPVMYLRGDLTYIGDAPIPEKLLQVVRERREAEKRK